MPKELSYSGPPVYVVALDREVEDGDSFEVPDKATADALLCASGFSVKGQTASTDTGPKIASKQELIDRAESMGLDVRSADTKESLASRISGAGGDPTVKGSS